MFVVNVRSIVKKMSLDEKGHEIVNRHDPKNKKKSHFNYYQKDLKQSIQELMKKRVLSTDIIIDDGKHSHEWVKVKDIKEVFGPGLT